MISLIGVFAANKRDTELRVHSGYVENIILKINDRENWRGYPEWTIQKHWQHWAHKKHDEDKQNTAAQRNT